MSRPTASAEAALDQAWREHWARLVGLVLAQYARPDLAEDAVAEAFAAAARTWPTAGVPTNPPAWLLTAARRRAVDALRAEAVQLRRQPVMAVEASIRAEAAAAEDPGAHIRDDVLRLVFTCCHPALAAEARVALTLRFVIGLDVGDIARLLLVQDTTMAARLTRAKKRLAASGIPLAVPSAERLDERLDVVATVVYLVFTAGYQPGPRPQALRTDLGDEAIRLGRLLDDLLPSRAVVRPLLALMLLQHSRRDARLDGEGRLVLLPEQDRTRWHGDEVRAGLELLATVPADVGLAEEYRLQALVAAEHATAPDAASTRWPVIAEHYAALERLTGSPVVRLARAVAVAEAEGPAAGLALLAGLDLALPRSHRLPAVRGELLARDGRAVEAVAELERALALATSPVETDHLRGRLAELR